jgi:hypothetical protein
MKKIKSIREAKKMEIMADSQDGDMDVTLQLQGKGV